MPHQKTQQDGSKQVCRLPPVLGEKSVPRRLKHEVAAGDTSRKSQLGDHRHKRHKSFLFLSKVRINGVRKYRSKHLFSLCLFITTQLWERTPQEPAIPLASAPEAYTAVAEGLSCNGCWHPVSKRSLPAYLSPHGL